MSVDMIVGPMGVEFPATVFSDLHLQGMSEDKKQGTLDSLAETVVNRAFVVGTERGSWGERRKLKKLWREHDRESFVSEARRAVPAFDGWLRESVTELINELKA